MRSYTSDTLTLGQQTYKRLGWFWVPMTAEDFSAIGAAEARRETIGWAITFTLAGLAFAAAVAKEILFH